MKKTTNYSKLVVLSILLLNITTFAQNWVFQKPLADLTVQKEIRTLVNGRAYLAGNAGFHVRDWDAPQWTKIDDGYIYEFDSNISWFALTRNMNAIYYPTYPTNGGIGMLANYVNNSTGAFFDFTEFDVPNCVYCHGNEATAIISNGTTVIASVDGLMRFVRSTDYGQSYYNSSTYAPLSGSVRTGDVVGTNTYMFGSKGGQIYLSTDNGATFQLQATHPFGFHKIKKAFGTRIYAITHELANEPNSSTYSLRYSTDNGLTWLLEATGLPVQKLNTLEFEGDWLYLAGDSGVYSKSSESASWVNESANLVNSSFNSISYVGGRLFSVTGNIGDNSNQVYSRADEVGAQWELFNQGISSTYNLKFVTGNKMILHSIGNNKYFLREAATGWTKQLATGENQDKPIQKVLTDSQGKLYILNGFNPSNGDNFILKKSIDGGLTFTSHSVDNSIYYYIMDIYSVNDSGLLLFSSNKSLYVYDFNTNTHQHIYTLANNESFIGKPLIDNNGVIYFTYTNNSVFGSRFSKKTTNLGSSFTDFSYGDTPFSAEKIIDQYIYDYQGQIRYNIVTNSIQNINLPANNAVLKIDLLRNNTHMFAQWYDNSVMPTQLHLYQSTNGGNSWTEINQPFNILNYDNFNGAYSYSTDLNNDLYLQVADYSNTSNSGIYKLTNALSSDTTTASIFSIYPNPTKGIIQISGLKQAEEVTIYNMLGQQVLTQKLTNANQTLDISALNSGSYFMKISALDTHQTITLLKE